MLNANNIEHLGLVPQYHTKQFSFPEPLTLLEILH